MTTTQERIQLLGEACRHRITRELLGEISETELTDWVSAELGHADALDVFHPHGNLSSKAFAPSSILHIVSGNTPHAALQSLLRGLVIGSNNTIKLPSLGLPDFEKWILTLPAELSRLVNCHSELTDDILHPADVIIATGSDTTIADIHSRLLPQQRFIPHGHKVSIGIVTEDFYNAARLAAKDCSLHNQRGCLSPHAIYVQGDTLHFGEILAQEMDNYCREDSPQPLSLSEAGAIQNLRQTTQFIAANDPLTHLWQSEGNLHWTVILEPDSTLKLSCLNRCIYVKPLPAKITTASLGPESQYLSTIALHPFSTVAAESLSHLPAHRICPLGSSQQPDLFWHHDGIAPLASLIKWKDIG